MNDTEGLWTLCSEALREQVSEASWRAYLAGITPLSIAGNEIVLGVPNTLIRDRVEARFLGLIQDTVVSTVGAPLDIRLEVVAPLHEPAEDTVAEFDRRSGSSDKHDEVGGPGASQLANLGDCLGK